MSPSSIARIDGTSKLVSLEFLMSRIVSVISLATDSGEIITLPLDITQ